MKTIIIFNQRVEPVSRYDIIDNINSAAAHLPQANYIYYDLTKATVYV